MRDWLNDIFEDNFALGCLVGVLIILLALGIAFGVLCFEAWVLMLLWNAIIVEVFAVGAITNFWWAVGIILICNILFKGVSTVTKKGE